MKTNLYGNGEGAVVTLDVQEEEVKVTVDYPVKILTFVASTFMGETYTASSTSVAAK